MPDNSPYVSGRHEQRFEQLWQEHAAAVVRYARRRVLPGEVDEVVAETFLVAWRRIDEVPDPALPWLFGVARGVSANVLRSARRRDALHERLAGQPMRRGTSHADPRELASALAQLSERDRELLTLIAWDGLAPAQAAEALGCSRATLAVRLHRARRRLRTALDAEAAEVDAATADDPTHIRTCDPMVVTD